MFYFDEDILLELAKDPDLTGAAWRVLVYLICLAESWESDTPEGNSYLPQEDIADSLGMDQEQLSAAMALLIGKKILAKKPGPQGPNVYQLNLDDGWEEITQELQKARRPKPALKLIDGGKSRAPTDSSLPKPKAKPRKHRLTHINAEEDP